MCERAELPLLISASLCPEGPYDFGGVLTNSNRDIINGDALHKRNQSYKEMHWSVSRAQLHVHRSVAFTEEKASTPLEFKLLGAGHPNGGWLEHLEMNVQL